MIPFENFRSKSNIFLNWSEKLILFESFRPKRDTSRILCAQTRIWSIVLGKIRNIQIFWVTIRRFLNVFDQNQILFKCSAWNFTFSQTFRSKLNIISIFGTNSTLFRMNWTKINYISNCHSKYLNVSDFSQNNWPNSCLCAKYSRCILFWSKRFKKNQLFTSNFEKYLILIWDFRKVSKLYSKYWRSIWFWPAILKKCWISTQKLTMCRIL